MAVRVDSARREHVVLSDDPPSAGPGGSGTFSFGATGMPPQAEAALAAGDRSATRKLMTSHIGHTRGLWVGRAEDDG